MNFSRLKQITLLISLMFIFSPYNAFAFNNCQFKYDGDKRALPQFKGMCNICHLNENGTGPQNEFGMAFAAAGFKITDDLVTKFPNLFQKPKDNSSSSGGEAPKPVIKRIKPTTVKTNVQTMISIMGKNFVNGAKAFIDDNETVTTFKSNVLLFADFILNSTGVHNITVQNPDEQKSNTVKLKSK